jgi:type VI secretion system FHA domain protein
MRRCPSRGWSILDLVPILPSQASVADGAGTFRTSIAKPPAGPCWSRGARPAWHSTEVPMTLTLTVLRCPPTVAAEVRQVSGDKFLIGRGPDNDWVLPDPSKHLSKRHCVIAFGQGVWKVTGTSTNGTFVNRVDTPLERRAPHTLIDGDRLILGSYEIAVGVVDDDQPTLGKAEPAPSRRRPPFGDRVASEPREGEPRAPGPLTPRLVPPTGRGEAPASASPIQPVAFTLPIQPVAFTSPIQPVAFTPPPQERNVFQWPPQPNNDEAVPNATSTRSSRPDSSEDWSLDDLARRSPMSHEADLAKPPPARPDVQASMPGTVSPASTNSDLFAEFLRGAGIETISSSDPVLTMRQLGAAFRAMVSGVRHALIARSDVKREFRIGATQIRQRGNNPLKFSADDDDALNGLLSTGRRTEMGPAEAIADALMDIRMHELATMTAMQTAVRALVAGLGPNQIRDDQGGGLALLGNRKARAWDAYEALHAEVVRGLSDDFDSLFGKRFAQAYEQAMQELLTRQNGQQDDFS